MCLVVTFYGVLDDRTSDMTLEFGDVAVFGCQMNLDRNPSPRVCLQSGTWGWEAPPGRGWPGAQPLLECPPAPNAHATTRPSSLFGGPGVNPSGSTVPEGREVSHGLFVASVLSEFKTGSFSGQYFFACQTRWTDM